MNFANYMSTYSQTENGADCFNSTGDSLVDMFANIGGMRNRESNDIISMWLNARKENKKLADNMILYVRDILNGGCGERRIGRILLRQLANIDPDKVRRNLNKIVDAGRWDDLFVLFDTPVEADMIEFIKDQLISDIKGMKDNKPISLLAKWLKSENTSSADSREMATRIRKGLKLSSKTYRKTLSALRKYIKVVETLMSNNEWEKINFEAVPALAMTRYTKAYGRHCEEAFEEYKRKLVKGEAKINTKTLYPYNIIMPAINGGVLDEIAEQQWKNLPNYLKDSNEQVVCVVDVSGSMFSNNNIPIATSVGLGLYFAQHNQGEYHNMFITFSGRPQIIQLKGGMSLTKAVREIKQANWGMSTDLNATFELIYNIAAKTRDVPKAIIIISDMEINQWSNEDRYLSITEKWNDKFNRIGLKCPRLIYWNVCSRHNNTLANCNDNIGFISGSSAGAFSFLELLLNCNHVKDAIIEILNKPQFTWN